MRQHAAPFRESKPESVRLEVRIVCRRVSILKCWGRKWVPIHTYPLEKTSGIQTLWVSGSFAFSQAFSKFSWNRLVSWKKPNPKSQEQRHIRVIRDDWPISPNASPWRVILRRILSNRHESWAILVAFSLVPRYPRPKNTLVAGLVCTPALKILWTDPPENTFSSTTTPK